MRLPGWLEAGRPIPQPDGKSVVVPVKLREALEGPTPIEPDPLFARLAKIAEQLDPGGRYGCRVAGCGWVLDVPAPRMETRTGGPWVVSWVGASRRKVDDVAAAHLDQHATNGAPPSDEPPSWAEIEWCDGGGSCEHESCLAALDAHLEVDG